LHLIDLTYFPSVWISYLAHSKLRRQILMRYCSLLLSVAALVLSAGSVAHADTFTVYDMNSTFSSGGTITGTMTLDDTTGAWSAGNLTASNFIVSNGQYTVVMNSGDDGVFIDTTADPFAYIFFDTVNPFSTYVGEDTIPIDVLQFNGEEGGEGAESASLTEVKSLGAPSTVPEPASLSLAGTGVLIGFCVLCRRSSSITGKRNQGVADVDLERATRLRN
jgi:PEP-CTERM motif